MSNVVATESFSITMERKCLCPLIVTHGPDQVPISSRFSLREDPSVVQNYGSLLEQLVQTIPDGLVPAQVSICKVKFGAILCKTDLFEYVCKKVKNQLQSPFETISL